MEQRRGSLRAIAAEIPRIAGAALGKRGFSEAQLVTQWETVVGPEMAKESAPERISFSRGERSNGTLRLTVTPGFALEAQHLEPVLIERINGFFGYAAVARIALVQGKLPRRAQARAPLRALRPAEGEALAASLAPIADPQLRAALERLGAAMIAAKNP